jgi:hypothetical protein
MRHSRAHAVSSDAQKTLDLLVLGFSCFRGGVDPLLTLIYYFVGAIPKLFRLLIYIIQSLSGPATDVLSQFFPGPRRKQ